MQRSNCGKNKKIKKLKNKKIKNERKAQNNKVIIQ